MANKSFYIGIAFTVLGVIVAGLSGVAFGYKQGERAAEVFAAGHIDRIAKIKADSLLACLYPAKRFGERVEVSALGDTVKILNPSVRVLFWTPGWWESNDDRSYRTFTRYREKIELYERLLLKEDRR